MFKTVHLRKLINVVLMLIIVATAILIPLSFMHKKRIAEKQNPPVQVADSFSRVSYLNLCGLKVDEENYSKQNVVIPRVFNETYSQYNILQNRQGFDLSKYKGKEAAVYTYDVLNYGKSNIKAVLIVKDGQLIGGDVHSTSERGYIVGLKG